MISYQISIDFFLISAGVYEISLVSDPSIYGIAHAASGPASRVRIAPATHPRMRKIHYAGFIKRFELLVRNI